MATYLPTANLSPTYSFFQFTTGAGVAALETALRAAFADQNVQVYADDNTVGNALVIVNGERAMSVPPNNYVGYNLGSWTNYAPAKMAGGGSSLFTAYP